jgi:molecular chaperone DnaK
LDGILPAPRGIPKIEVSFDIDANGILSVHAKDTATGKDQRITITASGGLNEEDVKRMVNEATAHEADDKRRREEVEQRNKLDTLCYTLEKTINESRDKLPESDLASLQGLIAEGRRAIETQDNASVVSVLEKLEKESHRIAQTLYEKATAEQGAPPPPQSGPRAAPGTEGVIDAEFEEDEDKRAAS